MPEQTAVTPADSTRVTFTNDQFKPAEQREDILRFLGVELGTSQYNADKTSITFHWEPFSFFAKDWDTNETLEGDRNRVDETFEISLTEGSKFHKTKQSWLAAFKVKDIADIEEWNALAPIMLKTQRRPTGKTSFDRQAKVSKPVLYRHIIGVVSDEEGEEARREAELRAKGQGEGGSDAAVAAEAVGMSDEDAVVDILSKNGPMSKSRLKALVIGDESLKAISGLMVGVSTGRLLNRLVEDGRLVLDGDEYSVA